MNEFNYIVVDKNGTLAGFIFLEDAKLFRNTYLDLGLASDKDIRICKSDSKEFIV